MNSAGVANRLALLLGNPKLAEKGLDHSGNSRGQ
jgi:hypothetical protein